MEKEFEAPSGKGGTVWLRGVRTQNLKGIDLEFPIHSLIAVTGVSGAGKTSLAAETLAAEGRRRFIETFPTATRRFLERLERPDCDEISPMPPAILHKHQQRQPGRRSTVATLADLAMPLQQLFTSAGQIYCPECQIPVVAHTASSAARVFAESDPGMRFLLGFRHSFDSKTVADVVASELLESGFQRVIIGESTLELKVPLPLDWPRSRDWLVVVDRLQTGKTSSDRLRDSLELAFQWGGGHCVAIFHTAQVMDGRALTLDGQQVVKQEFHTRPICVRCEREFAPLSQRQFAFNSPLGACPKCRGLGLYEERPCPECQGLRLKTESLAVQVGTFKFAAILTKTLHQLAENLENWRQELPDSIANLAEPWIKQLARRLDLLNRLGLGYLELNRSGRTLSSGESQRLSLASICAVELVNSLYVLEEPASGLHTENLSQLVEILQELTSRRNTVVMTEHVKQLIRSSDYVLDLGPGAGPDGGQLVFQGTSHELVNEVKSATAEYLGGRKQVTPRKRRISSDWLKLRGVTHRTLQNVDVEFPLGLLCAVTGVSGAGKTTLIRDVLLPALSELLNPETSPAVPVQLQELTGHESLQSVVYVDQTLPERSSRGNVATTSGIWPEIRAILGGTPEAKLRQFTAGTFSFHNARGGRCPVCEGRGYLAIDLQFLADVTTVCPDCSGTRFQREVLEVKYRGQHVAEILQLTVSAGLAFFRGRSRLQRRLKGLKDVGLGYLQLGQPVASLSGGEIQRLKLAERMTAKPAGATLFLLDEPARGLHPADIQGLVNWFDDLLNEGHSVIVIEHRQELIHACDHVIELRIPTGDRNALRISSFANS